MEQSSVLFSPISPQLREAAESPDLQRDKRWRLCEISDCSILWRATGLEERGALGSTPRGRTAGPREEGWLGLGLMEPCHDPGGSQHPWPWVTGRLSPSGQWESADPPNISWASCWFWSICRPDCAAACRGARARTCQPGGGVCPGPAPGVLLPCALIARSPTGCRGLLSGSLRPHPRWEGLGDAGKWLCLLHCLRQQEVRSLGAVPACGCE